MNALALIDVREGPVVKQAKLTGPLYRVRAIPKGEAGRKFASYHHLHESAGSVPEG